MSEPTPVPRIELPEYVSAVGWSVGWDSLTLQSPLQNFMILSCVAATIVLAGRMVLIPSVSEEEWWRRDRASGLTFLEPGR